MAESIGPLRSPSSRRVAAGGGGGFPGHRLAGREGSPSKPTSPRALPPIVVDRETLTTALKNLLDNAVNNSRESRTVRLEAQDKRRRISIPVRDRGVGIREEDRPRILLEKCYREAESCRAKSKVSASA